MNDIDLKEAIAAEDNDVIQYFIMKQRDLLVKEWLTKSPQEFYTTLRLSSQKMHRAKRQFDNLNKEILYQISIWEGMIQAFETLYVKTIRTKKIVEAISDENSETAKIIRFLQKHDKPICHVELANSLGMDYAALTNAMKHSILCGAVSASRTGKNTTYMLTPIVKEYFTEL